MSTFISKVKNLSQKAAEIKAAMQQVPPKVAEIREAVAATTGQLQQLKSEIQHSVADLKADNETSLSHALQEINASAEVFAKAGFTLGGVDLEISPVQRLLVHLAHVEDVHASVLRALLSANQPRRTTHAILSSLLQAKQMAETIELAELSYSEVIVGIGPIPSVRLCWHPTAMPAAEPAPALPAATLPPPLVAPAPAAQSFFGPGAFFEKRAPALAAAVIEPMVVPTSSAAPLHSRTEVQPEVLESGSSDPLARFKKMPNLARSKR